VSNEFLIVEIYDRESIWRNLGQEEKESFLRRVIKMLFCEGRHETGGIMEKMVKELSES
jgi:hypothetical protein